MLLPFHGRRLCGPLDGINSPWIDYYSPLTMPLLTQEPDILERTQQTVNMAGQEELARNPWVCPQTMQGPSMLVILTVTSL